MATQIDVYREAARLLGDYRIAALTDDSPQIYAFDDSWERTVLYVLRQSFWRFAMRTEAMEDVSAVDPVPGYSYAYDLPADWLRTHAIFQVGANDALECPIDLRHTLEQINVNIPNIYIRYISDDYTDPDTWPEHFAHAVACRLAFDCAERITGNPAKTDQMEKKWQEAMQLAVAPDALPENPWLRFQMDGSMLFGTNSMLGAHCWSFARKTVELTGDTSNVSPGYTYAVDKPDDMWRVFFFYYPMGNTWIDIDFRDEDGRFHTQYQNTVLRYVSTDGLDSLNWSDDFRSSLLAFMEFEEAKRNPGTPGAVLQAKKMAMDDAYKTGKLKDAMNERPRYNDEGILSRSRRGSGVGGLARQQGWW